MKIRIIIGLIAVLMVGGCQKKVTKQSELTPISLDESATDRTAIQEKSESELFQLPSDEAIRSEDVAPDGLQFQTIYFEFDQAELNGEARAILSGHAQLLRKYPGVKILIEGHCDERGTIEYNLALGARRAQIVRQYLVNSGIAETRIATLSYGKERPADPGHHEGAWIKNRRAVFVIRQR